MSKNVPIEGAYTSGSSIIKELHVAVGIIFNSESQYLLNYRPKELPLGGFWEFPGGIIEDKDPFETLKRELFEELNIQVQTAEPLTKVKFIHEHVLITLHGWIVTAYSGEPTNAEGQQIRWLRFAEIEQLSMTQPTFAILNQFQQTLTHPEPNKLPSTSKSNDKLNIDVLQWSDIRNEVAAVNPELASIIDDINPGSEPKLYKARYRYGDRILAEGNGLNLPLRKGGVTALHNESMVPKTIRDNLSHSAVPIALVLHNSLEICVNAKKQAVPLRLFSQGEIIGLFETLAKKSVDKISNWNLYAGSASMFILPKINDHAAHTKLKKSYNLTANCPKGYHDHFAIFQGISETCNLNNSPWHCELLFFSRHWFEKLDRKTGSLLLNNYFFSRMTEQSQHFHNKLALDRAWHYFSQELVAKHKFYSPYIMGTVKHLISITIDLVPSYRPARDDTFGPICDIQKAYTSTYRLSVAPTLMIPSFFNLESNSYPIYYSLRYPSMLTTHPRFKEKKSLITDLIHISSLCSDFYSLAINGRLKVENTILEKAISKTLFEYFHSKPDESTYYHIKSSRGMPKLDTSLTTCLPNNQPEKFTNNGRFIRSCIRILKKGANTSHSSKNEVHSP